MKSKEEVHRHVERAFAFMVETTTHDGRGGEPNMEWHARRVIEEMKDLPPDLRREAIEAARACARRPWDGAPWRGIDLEWLRDLVIEGLEA